MAFLFTDIRGFTTICEGMEPSEVVDILNSYLDLQATIIEENNGDIDKFVGDEMMATFDGPHKELDACRASMQLREAMQKEKDERERTNLKTMSIGIGINTGKVTFGNVGAKERMDFTSIGDTVNLAARLEGANKEYNTKTLISEFVYEKVKDHFICREIDLIQVKGKTRPVIIYEILQIKDKTSKKLQEMKKYFEEGLVRYRKRKWDDAAKYFNKLIEDYSDSTSRVFISRIEHFKNNPPPKKWDGVFTMKVK
ncbi:MAG: adenylate/guanylate cyclase domain-containing protein, partial [Spirochaetes bacterium]|nr:adenylate/guanylate cyclase domain-containing protein [Spirochaetota bacterium]